MAYSKSIIFGRTGIFGMVLEAINDYYGHCSCIDDINFPVNLLKNPMRLMPMNEMAHYFSYIEDHIHDDLFILRSASNMNINRFDPIRSLICTTPVLFTSIMRFNSLLRAIQSDCKILTLSDDNTIKWCYDTKLSIAEPRLYDGIVNAWIFIHILRHYTNEHFSPDMVHLPGFQRGTNGEAEKIFGCKVVWNAKRTEVWFPSNHLKKYAPALSTINSESKIEHTQVLNYINLPDPNDFARCVYELINYAREFGYPKLEFVAEMLMISPLTLQRRLQKENLSFSELVKYQLLFNIAPELIKSGLTESKISKQLGFNNTQSFTKAFKKAHGFTPKQFLEHLEHYS